MYERQKADNIELWNMQNEYNAPVNQMRLLKEAGLNPNLVYGSGATTAQADSIHTGSPGNPQFDTPDIASIGNSIGNSMAQFMDLKMRKAQIQGQEQQNALLAQEKKLKEIQEKSDQFDLDMKDNLRSYTLQGAELDYQTRSNRYNYEKNDEIRKAAAASSNLKEAAERILRSQQERTLVPARKKYIGELIQNIDQDQQIKQFEIDLNKKGITKNDPSYLRILSELWDNYKEEILNFN